MKKNIITSFLVLSLLIVLFGGCSNKSSSIEFNVGTSQGEGSTIYAGLIEMKKAVKNRTEGNLIVNIFPSSQLGSEEDIIEQAKLGANVGTITDNGRLSEYVRELGVVGVAYVADDYTQMKKIVESDIYANWAMKLNEDNLEILSMNWYQGGRNFFTNKMISSPEDLKGLLIRTPSPPVWIKSIESLGATAVPMAWTETYPAMQQNVIDGFEVQPTAAADSSLQETVKFMIQTEHFQLISGIVAGYKFMNSLPEEYRTILSEEANKAGDFESKLEIERSSMVVKNFKETGLEIISIDRTPFKTAAKEALKELDYEKEYNALKKINF